MKFSSRKQTWLCLCSLLLSGSCLAAKERPTIGLALSGGGVKGFSQIGVLKVFEEIGLPIDYISGSSMGSVVGGLYAIGYTAGELEELVVITDWDEIFSDNLGRRSFAMNQKLWDERTILTLPIHSGRIAVPSGLRSGQKVSRLLSRLTLSAHGIDDFTNFPIPFVCLATDIETGEGVPLDSGILAEAIRASMAIPSVFTPVEIDGRRLVDGGEVRTVPVDDVLRFHPDIVIGVDATSRLYEKEQLSSLMTIYDQTMRFRKVQSNIEQLSKADLVIRPDFKGLSMTDYKQGKTFIERGERAARAILPELQALVDSLGVRSNNYKIRIKPQVPDFFFIVNIEIVGARASSENLILKELDIQVPALYTLQEIEGTVDRMYSLQLFERVVYAIQPDSIGSKLYIKVTESNLDEFRFGLRYDSTNDAAVLLNTLFRNVIFQNALLNLDLKLGRQVRFDGQFLVPIGLIPSFALRARVNYFDDLIAIFVGQNREARFDVKSTFFEGLVGNFFSSQINVAGGFRSEYINSNSNIASPAIADSLALSQSTLSFLYQIWIDSMDRISFPTKGVSAVFKHEFANEAIASERTFSRRFFDLRVIVPASKMVSLSAEILLGTTSGDVPLYYGFFLGNLDRPVLFPDRLLSWVSFVGLNNQELSGKHAQFFQAGLQYEFFPKYFLALRANAGNTFEEWKLQLSRKRFASGVGLTVGRETVLGPVEFTAMGGTRHKLILHVNLGYRF